MVSPRDTIYVFILFYWTTIALQYCVSFCCTASWISYMYTHILSLLSLPPILHSTLLGLHRAGSEALFADSSFPLAVYLTQVVSVRGEGNGTPLQYSCLENPMDGRAWRGAVHGISKSDMTKHSTHSRKAAQVLSWCPPEIWGCFISKKQNLTKSQSFLLLQIIQSWFFQHPVLRNLVDWGVHLLNNSWLFLYQKQWGMPHFPFSLPHLSLLTLVVLGLHLPNKALALSHVWFFATPWIVACQSSLSMEFFQARILEWVAISCSRGSSWPGI